MIGEIPITLTYQGNVFIYHLSPQYGMPNFKAIQLHLSLSNRKMVGTPWKGYKLAACLKEVPSYISRN